MAPFLLNPLQILLLALFASHSLLALAQETNQFLYNGFIDSNLTINGMTIIHPNGILELTNTSKQQIGHAFFPFPIHFNSSASNNSSSSSSNGVLSFSTTFVFAMVPESPTLGGHGIAFVISPSSDFKSATATQYLGLFNSTTIGLSSNRIVAIELDTVQNPEFEDIDNNHVGIDINNLTSSQSASAAYFTAEGEANELELMSGEPMQVWIEYHATEKQLNVTLAPVRTRKPEKPLLSSITDLSLILLDQMYIGFSSSTGSVASHHYILGWSFNLTGPAPDLDISSLPLPPHNRNSGRKVPNLKILLPAIVAILLIPTIALTIYFTRKRYEELREDWEEQYGPQRFSYRELHRATKGFKDGQVLGSGGFGRVYRGTLPASNVEVAVKKISHNSRQGMKEFIAEIASMGRLRHRNLVQLLGYCRRKGELFLVYDYMPNGSLDQLLFSSRDGDGATRNSNLNWVQRYQIVKGVAAALVYLHEEWEQVVIHRDVKASNVLLDADLNGRLGDFGMARFYDHGSDLQTTNVVGTVGYLAPELSRTGRATTRSDVFAFGVFMLEVACGRRPVEARERAEEAVLVDWAVECWRRGELLKTGDPKLQGDYEVEEMEMVLKLGLICAHRSPAARPTMRMVMQSLEKNVALPEISLQGAGVGDHRRRDGSGDWLLQFPVSTDEISGSYSISDADSILNSGR